MTLPQGPLRGAWAAGRPHTGCRVRCDGAVEAERARGRALTTAARLHEAANGRRPRGMAGPAPTRVTQSPGGDAQLLTLLCGPPLRRLPGPSTSNSTKQTGTSGHVVNRILVEAKCPLLTEEVAGNGNTFYDPSLVMGNGSHAGYSG